MMARKRLNEIVTTIGDMFFGLMSFDVDTEKCIIHADQADAFESVMITWDVSEVVSLRDYLNEVIDFMKGTDHDKI